MRNPQFYVSGKRPMQRLPRLPILLMVRTVQCFVVFWYELIYSCPCVTAIQGSHESNKNCQNYIISLIVIDTISIICFCFLNKILPDINSANNFILRRDLPCQGLRDLIDFDRVAKLTVVIYCKDHNITKVIYLPIYLPVSL